MTIHMIYTFFFDDTLQKQTQFEAKKTTNKIIDIPQERLIASFPIDILYHSETKKTIRI